MTSNLMLREPSPETRGHEGISAVIVFRSAAWKAASPELHLSSRWCTRWLILCIASIASQLTDAVFFGRGDGDDDGDGNGVVNVRLWCRQGLYNAKGRLFSVEVLIFVYPGLD